VADPNAPAWIARTVMSCRPGVERRLLKQATGTPPADTGAGVARFDVAPGEAVLVGDVATSLPAQGYDDRSGTLVVDLSAAQTTFRISGPAARSLVAKGAAIDLDDRHFAVGAGTHCRFGAYRVLLHRVADDGYDLHVDRSLGDALSSYVMELGAEFGVVGE
jgi:heterotetrameric sarcosine oxidase gamma subunit